LNILIGGNMKKKNNEPVYSIIDLHNYALSLRENAARSFTEDYTENLDEFISLAQIINLIKKHSLGKDEEGNYLIHSTVFDETFNEIRNWLYGVGLARLAAKGLVECAWDNDLNEMIFWLSNDTKTTIPNKPDNNE
jgi:hypothetical protein